MPSETDSTESVSGTGIVTPVPPRERRGTSIGRYILIDLLGSGGMGVVYSAYDAELDRRVAIKILHPRVSASEQAADIGARLRREAQAMARLSHPNVVAVHDVGTFEGSVFLAMEYVEGGTLRAWLRAERTWRQRLDVLKAAGRGLAAAHRADLVHRDFKPENVLVGSDGRVRVTDFGIARAAGSPSEPGDGSAPAAHEMATRAGGRASTPEESTGSGPGVTSPTADAGTPSGPLLDAPLTVSGSILGTVGYMAPEQAFGLPVDARSDQFSFCVTLYFALYGVKPFASRDLSTYVTALGAAPAPAPRDSNVPAWLRRVVLRGLSDKPEDRHASMDALLRALDDEPKRRRRRWIGALAVAGGAALTAAVWMRPPAAAQPAPCSGAGEKLESAWNDAKRTEIRAAFDALRTPGSSEVLASVGSALDAYAAGWVGMRTDACLATRVRGEQSSELLDLRMECLDDRLSEMRGLVDELTRCDAQTFERAAQAALSLTPISACADAAALTAPVPPPRDPKVRAQVDAVRERLAVGISENRLSRYSQAQKVAEEAVERARATDYRPLEAEALFLLGDTQISLEDDKAAKGTLIRAEAAALAGKQPDIVARALSDLVVVASHLGAFEEGHHWADLAEAAATHADLVAQGESADDLGQLLLDEGRLDEAQTALERGIGLWERALGHDDIELADPLTDLANVYLAQGKYGEAKAMNERAIFVVEKAVGKNALVASNVNNLGDICLHGADYDCAIASYQQSHDWYVSSHGESYFASAVTLSNLGDAWREKGDAARALPYCERAVAILSGGDAGDRFYEGDALSALAETLRALGRLPQALVAYQRALAMKEKALGPDHVDLAAPLTGIGRTLLDQQKPSLARAPLARALALREAHPGDPYDAAETRFALARAVVQADGSRARELATRAENDFATRGPRGEKRAAEVAAWLAGRR